MLFCDHPVSSYLFSRQGEREVGIFSATTILVSIAFAVLGVTLLKKVFEALSGKMDSRIETIGNLLKALEAGIITETTITITTITTTIITTIMGMAIITIMQMKFLIRGDGRRRMYLHAL